MKYELNEIERLIYDRLYLQFLESKEEQDRFLTDFHEKIELVQIVLKEKVFLPVKERQVERYIQGHQAGVIALVDEISTRLKGSDAQDILKSLVKNYGNCFHLSSDTSHVTSTWI